MADKPVKAAPGGEANTDAARLAEEALDQASSAVADLRAAAEAGEATGTNLDLPTFKQVIADAEASGIDLLHDVNLNVSIELGRTHMLVEDVLRLSEGSVVELDKLAGDPVDIYVNDRLVARGEVLVLNDNFCVRVSEIIASIEDVAAEGAEQIADSPTA